MCRRLEAKVRGVLVGDQLRIVENEVLTTLRMFIEQLVRNGQRIRCELEDRQSFRDKKLQEKEKNLSKRATELLNLAQQDDETVQVSRPMFAFASCANGIGMQPQYQKTHA